MTLLPLTYIQLLALSCSMSMFKMSLLLFPSILLLFSTCPVCPSCPVSSYTIHKSSSIVFISFLHPLILAHLCPASSLIWFSLCSFFLLFYTILLFFPLTVRFFFFTKIFIYSFHPSCTSSSSFHHPLSSSVSSSFLLILHLHVAAAHWSWVSPSCSEQLTCWKQVTVAKVIRQDGCIWRWMRGRLLWWLEGPRAKTPEWLICLSLSLQSCKHKTRRRRAFLEERLLIKTHTWPKIIWNNWVAEISDVIQVWPMSAFESLKQNVIICVICIA